MSTIDIQEVMMPKKESGKGAASSFVTRAVALEAYAASIDATALSAQEKTWAYEGALIKLAVGFEKFMLDALIAATNSDTQQMSQTLGVGFPKHLTDEVCKYIVTRGKYFDFKGRDGLLGKIKGLVGNSHYLYVAVQQPKCKSALEQLIALRNFAAHESSQSRRAALQALQRKNLASAGSYVKRQGRLVSLSKELRALASDIQTAAPY